MSRKEGINEVLQEALEDVESRFLLNLTYEELTQADRLFFQIEQAHWYYEDFKADRNPKLPHFKTLRAFAEKIFVHCPLLNNMSDQFQQLFSDFRAYKQKIPVFGCILLNPAMNKVLLVCDYGSKSWTFPRGKINENEDPFNCAMREVFEETNFDPTPYCNPDEFLTIFQEDKKIQLYIGVNIPEDTSFSISTRKEISSIQFHRIDNIPTNTFHVQPFMPKLKRWIFKRNKAAMGKSTGKSPKMNALIPGKVKIKTRNSDANNPTTTQNTSAATESKVNPVLLTPNSHRKLKNAFDARNVDTFQTSGRSTQRWSVEDMFKANAALTGKAYQYDGNPHAFGASHPKFIDYTRLPSATYSQSLFHDKNNGNSDSDYFELCKQSFQLGEKLLHDRDIESPQLMDHFMLPSSAAYTRQQTKSEHPMFSWRIKFAQPFQLDKAEIMKAMDDVLNSKARG